MRNPISENEKLLMLRRNVKPELKIVLLYQNVRNPGELTDLCRKFEKLSCQLGEDRPLRNIRRSIDEVQFDNYDDGQMYDDEHDYNPFPDGPAYQEVSQIESQSNNVICWNCKGIGHTYQACTKPVPLNGIFCFGCGAPNILKPNCFICMEQVPKPNTELDVSGKSGSDSYRTSWTDTERSVANGQATISFDFVSNGGSLGLGSSLINRNSNSNNRYNRGLKFWSDIKSCRAEIGSTVL